MNELTELNDIKKCSIEGCNSPYYCKDLCRKHYNKNYRHLNIGKSLSYNIEYRLKFKDKVREYDKKYSTSDNGRFNKARSKAKIRKLDFTVTFDQFIEISGAPCYYCQDELCGKDNFQGAHLDRIDNSKGYTLDNVLSCGILCNRIRMNNLTVEETKDAVVGILNGRKRRIYDKKTGERSIE